MWSRPFTFGGRQVRVEEGWGVGIGEGEGQKPVPARASASVPPVSVLSVACRRNCMGRWCAVGSVLKVCYLHFLTAPL